MASSAQRKVMVVFGTRPEAIKMAPVVAALRRSSSLLPVVCVTAQHRAMLDQMLDVFDIRPDVDLDVMRPDQRLDELTARVLTEMSAVLAKQRPDVVLVHGDTTTTFAAALAAFYLGVPVGHVEAGLRSHDLRQPFPEEMNRVLADRLCRFHFAPTDRAREALVAEGAPPAHVVVTGNTVVDAVLSALPRAGAAKIPGLPDLTGRRMVLVTAHRRESFGTTFREMMRALIDITERFADVQLVYPVHLNPNVRRPVRAILDGHPRVTLLEPLSYLPFLRLMRDAHLILTDSGGIQEEAPSLDKPVLVMRQVTERPEGVDAGVTRLVGTRRDDIVREVAELLTDQEAYAEMARRPSPFGDGHAAERIAAHLAQNL